KEHLADEQPAQQASTPPPVSAPPPLSPPEADEDDFYIDDNFDLSLLDKLSGSESASQNDSATPDSRQQDDLPAPLQDQQQERENDPMDGKQGTPSTPDLSPPATAPTADLAAEGPTSVAAPAKDDPPPVAPAAALPLGANQAAPLSEPDDSEALTQDSSTAPQTTSATAAPAVPALSADLMPPAFGTDHFAEQESDNGARRSHWLWYPLLVIGILALPLQYAHFHADVLGQEPRWRPFMESLCQATGCSLAPLANLERIATTNLVVRSHPDQPAALRVDATLITRASFAQPFPLLILSFTNLEGDIVASRNFSPAEYLGGELKGVAQMPIQQP